MIVCNDPSHMINEFNFILPLFRKVEQKQLAEYKISLTNKHFQKKTKNVDSIYVFIFNLLRFFTSFKSLRFLLHFFSKSGRIKLK